ncbi:MAG: FtsX-like permease family protein [Gemmatimonas sp.]|nr:FtsX-like permease family protein [Gemmatimonas sp.]
MRRIPGIRRLLRLPPSGKRIAGEVGDEIAFHLEERTRELVEQGLDLRAAREQASREFGSVAEASAELEEIDRRRARRSTRSAWWDDLVSDVRYAARTFRRGPTFAAVVILTLALGIGANTAIFSVVNGVLLRPLPYPDGLMMVWSHAIDAPSDGAPLSGPDMNDVRDLDAVSAIEGIALTDLTLTGFEATELVRVARVTGGLLRLFDLTPALGRNLTHEDNVEGAARVVLVGHDFWQTHLGGRREVLGTTIELNEESYELVGVAPAGFRFPVGGTFGPEGVQLWTADRRTESRRTMLYNATIARLTPGVPLERASGDLDALAVALSGEYPRLAHQERLRFERLEDFIVGAVRRPLWIVLGAVGLVLLIACANVANLLLVRASARREEVAVRAALGASRRRLMTQVLVESLVLAVGGGAIGLLLAVGGVEILKEFGPDAIPRLDQISLDATVLAFSSAVTIVVALLFGLSPALHAADTSLVENLRSDSRSGQPARQRWFRQLLLSVEIALSLVLLAGAGLLTRSLIKLYQVELGFDAREVVRFDLSLPSARYDSLATVVSFYEALEERISAEPGVQAVGSTVGAPLRDRGSGGFVLFEGTPEPEPGEELIGWIRPVTPSYFEAMGLRLLRGRGIEATDRSANLPVAVVNETLVREALGGENPIGKRFGATIDVGIGRPKWTVVGVVADERPSLEEDLRPEFYVPHAQSGSRSLTVHVRGNPGASNLLAGVREHVHTLDPNLPLRQPETVREAIRDDAASTRFFLLLVALFAALAVVLAIVGLYGVVSRLASQRTREFGIRIALGAQRQTITALVLRQALWPALLGVAGGLLASIAVTRVMRSLLFEVEPMDPLVLAVVSFSLLMIAAAASLLPARRASRLDPVEVLRIE